MDLKATENMINTALRHCSDIGMFALDRPENSCRWATSFCMEHCYNAKFYRLWGNGLRSKDKKSEQAWQNMNGGCLARVLDRKRKDTSRIRLMTRGEALKTTLDVHRVQLICRANSDRLVWLPTRAWRGDLRETIERRLFPLDNLRLMASIDPSNSAEEVESLVAAGWSTMFFGDDLAMSGRFLCPKTHNHALGHCLTCSGGCFSASQVHVHLNSH